MEFFKKYGEIPIMGMLFLLYTWLYCSISFVTIKNVLSAIGAFAIGWIISKASFWMRDKIVEIVENGGID